MAAIPGVRGIERRWNFALSIADIEKDAQTANINIANPFFMNVIDNILNDNTTVSIHRLPALQYFPININLLQDHDIRGIIADTINVNVVNATPINSHFHPVNAIFRERYSKPEYNPGGVLLIIGPNQQQALTIGIQTFLPGPNQIQLFNFIKNPMNNLQNPIEKITPSYFFDPGVTRQHFNAGLFFWCWWAMHRPSILAPAGALASFYSNNSIIRHIGGINGVGGFEAIEINLYNAGIATIPYRVLRIFFDLSDRTLTFMLVNITNNTIVYRIDKNIYNNTCLLNNPRPVHYNDHIVVRHLGPPGPPGLPQVIPQGILPLLQQQGYVQVPAPQAQQAQQLANERNQTCIYIAGNAENGNFINNIGDYGVANVNNDRDEAIKFILSKLMADYLHCFFCEQNDAVLTHDINLRTRCIGNRKKVIHRQGNGNAATYTLYTPITPNPLPAGRRFAGLSANPARPIPSGNRVGIPQFGGAHSKEQTIKENEMHFSILNDRITAVIIELQKSLTYDKYKTNPKIKNYITTTVEFLGLLVPYLNKTLDKSLDTTEYIDTLIQWLPVSPFFQKQRIYPTFKPVNISDDIFIPHRIGRLFPYQKDIIQISNKSFKNKYEVGTFYNFIQQSLEGQNYTKKSTKLSVEPNLTFRTILKTIETHKDDDDDKLIESLLKSKNVTTLKESIELLHDGVIKYRMIDLDIVKCIFISVVPDIVSACRVYDLFMNLVLFQGIYVFNYKIIETFVYIMNNTSNGLEFSYGLKGLEFIMSLYDSNLQDDEIQRKINEYIAPPIRPTPISMALFGPSGIPNIKKPNPTKAVRQTIRQLKKSKLIQKPNLTEDMNPSLFKPIIPNSNMLSTQATERYRSGSPVPKAVERYGSGSPVHNAIRKPIGDSNSNNKSIIEELRFVNNESTTQGTEVGSLVSTRRPSTTNSNLLTQLGIRRRKTRKNRSKKQRKTRRR